MPYSFQKKEGVKNCCKVDDNLEQSPTDREDTVKLVCKVCGARHRIWTVETGKMIATHRG